MFDKIDEKDIAYLIGFLSGDGGFSDGFGKRGNRMAISTTDEEIVDWISSHIEEFSKESAVLNDNPKAGIFARLPAYRKTFNTSWTPLFNKYGIVCKKESRSVQNISKKNMKYFIMGFLDADGCISFTQRKDRDRICAKVSFTHPSIKLLEKIQGFLSEELCICSTIKPKGAEKCFVLSCSKIEGVEKFCSWLYSEKNRIVLKRKYNKWCELKTELRSKREGDCACYPREFIETSEYISLVSTIGRNMFFVEGNWYPSAGMAANAVGVDKNTVHSRCAQGNKGWGRRPKTEQEKAEYASYVKRQIKKLYKDWEENK